MTMSLPNNLFLI